MTYRYRVNGTNKLRNEFTKINDEVTTSKKDTALALRKARVKYKKAPELSVTEILSE